MNVLANMMRPGNDPQIRRSGRSSMSGADRLARNLGWFSIALGVAELFAADRIARALGMRDKEALIRGYGLREISSGMLCLSIDKKAGLVSRIAGDGLDIATLSHGLNPLNPKRDNVAMAMLMVSVIGVIDVVATKLILARHNRGSQPPRSYRDRSGFPQGVGAARGQACNVKAPAGLQEVPVVA